MKITCIFTCLVLIMSSACQNRRINESVISSIQRTDDVDLFDRLTNQLWCSQTFEEEQQNRQLRDSDYSIVRYSFHRDGTYDFSRNVHYSDVTTVPGESDRGIWNFHKTSNTGGIIYLTYGNLRYYNGDWVKTNADVLHFSFDEDGSLTIANNLLRACHEIEKKEQNKTVEELSEIKPSEGYAKLIRTKWKKANEFNLYLMPTEIEFQENGNYTASYRHGECSLTDVFSLRKNEIIRHIPQKDCDERPLPSDNQSDGRFYPHPIRFEDDFLIFEDALYVPENFQLIGGMEYIGWQDDRSYLKIRFAHQIKNRETIPMTIELKNNKSDYGFITSFSLSEQSSKKNSTGNFSPNGEEKILSIIDFSSSPIEAGQTQTFAVNPVFSVKGMGTISFILTYETNNKSYESRETFLLEY